MWNPTVFPYFHGDEGHYIRRAMHVLEGLGPQEQRNTTWSFEQPYDHPYFGQLILAAGLVMINYPEFVDARPGDVKSVETLHQVPRLILGGLAVIDTFLIYKIAEGRYSRKVAFISALLFAVMPMGWLLRRVFLDSLLLPFLLTSVLFAVRSQYQSNPRDNWTQLETKMVFVNRNMLLTISLSGIFLGFAIFTKISAFAFIPLIFFLIYSKAMRVNKRNRVLLLGIWLVPIILIPSIWPGYAFLLGQFDEWISGISWQADRTQTSAYTIHDLFRIDSVLYLTGIVGSFYALIRRDILIILWIIPLIIFFSAVGHVRFPYWIPVIPIFCIATAQLIVGLSNKISGRKIRQLLSFGTVALIGIVGLSTFAILLTTTNVNATFFELYAFINENLPDNSNNENQNDRSITLMGSNWMQTFSWIPEYVFDKEHNFKTFLREKNLPIQDGEKVMLLVDNKDLDLFILSENSTKTFKQKDLYHNTKHLATFDKKPLKYYFLLSGLGSENPSLDKVEVRTNY
jgi:hypothetical protein